MHQVTPAAERPMRVLPPVGLSGVEDTGDKIAGATHAIIVCC